MKLNDLRTGMKVTLRNGQECIVLLNFSHGYDDATDILLNVENLYWDPLTSYTEDLKHQTFKNEDIVKIEQPNHAYAIFKSVGYGFTTIWERKERKNMTIEEIEAELGYPIKIIGG